MVCRTLLSRLATECGVTISASTLRNELKRMGYVRKRTRYNLKKRDPDRFEQTRHDIGELIEQAKAREIELAYVDEARFTPQPPRSTWTRNGETHAVTAKRGQRLNVIGAWLLSGRLMTAKWWQSVNGLWFFGFLMTLIERISKPLVVILVNASIHTAKKLKPYRDLLKKKVCDFISCRLTA